MVRNLHRHLNGGRKGGDSFIGRLVLQHPALHLLDAARLRDYHEKTRPVLELFRRKEVVHDIDAQPSADQVQKSIRETLGLPAYSPPE